MKKYINLNLSLLAFCLLLPLQAQSSEVVSLEQLLNNVKSGHVSDKKAADEREKRFQADKETQQRLLKDTIAERKTEEKRSETLEANFDKNDIKINELRLQLAEELGDLKELLGTIQTTASETQVNFDASLVSAQIPGRGEKLGELVSQIGQSNTLVSMDDIEDVWYQLQREMVEQGKVATFNASIANAAGETSEASVTRVGVFNAVSDGQFLRYTDEAGLSVLPRQPQSRYLAQAKNIQTAQSGLVDFSIDPTRGQLLGALVANPTLSERVEQGGVVGYIIIALGVIAVLVALYKIFALSLTETAVKRQVKNLDKASPKNALGRILTVYNDNPDSDLESIELKLGEAIMKETPKLNRWLMFIKIIAVVAPLLGLLGTVTGMIQTFQAITLFGAGDPKLMAGGISQALVTTVLGLVVAIPTILLHTAAQSRAKRIQEVLEEQSAGMVARQVETK